MNVLIEQFNKELILVPIELYKNSLQTNESNQMTSSNYASYPNYFVSYGCYKISHWDYNNGIFELKPIFDSNNLYSVIKIFFTHSIKEQEELFLKGELTKLEIDTPFTKEKIQKFLTPLYQINYYNSLKNESDNANMTSLYLNFGQDENSNYSKNLNFRKFLFYAINRQKLYEELQNDTDEKNSYL